MLTILLHSSKTMRLPGLHSASYQAPALLKQATELADYMKSLNVSQLMQHMQLSKTKAAQTHELLQSWTSRPEQQRPAIDAFLGDIYSGLQAQSFTSADRAYANKHLLILSGLYGGLRALDSIYPYRLEMGYKLPDTRYKTLYEFWGDSVAKLIPSNGTVVNLSAVEYTKSVLPYLPNTTVVSPRFLTLSPKTGEPTFVTVHAKVARGAFAHWMIQHRIDSLDKLKNFSELNYHYDASASTHNEPVFVCKKFGGLGLSVRLT